MFTVIIFGMITNTLLSILLMILIITIIFTNITPTFRPFHPFRSTCRERISIILFPQDPSWTLPTLKPQEHRWSLYSTWRPQMGTDVRKKG